jgi:hypothetical protein
VVDAAIALGAVLAALVALLAVPISVFVRVERAAVLEASWRVRWLFGLVDVQSSRTGTAAGPGTGDTKERPARRAGRRRRRAGSRFGPGTVVAVLGARGFVQRVLRLLGDLRRQVRWDDVHLRAEFGLDDPADTGVMYGAMVPLLLAANRVGLDVGCRPNFAGTCLAGSAGATFGTRPIALLRVLAAFLCSPAVGRAVRAAWRSRRKT